MTSVLLVALGGAVGSAARAAVTLALPGSPMAATALVNVVGAFLLAVLLASLAARGDVRRDGDADDAGEADRARGRRRRGARLLLGTGFCGGFTTYSAVAVQVAELASGSAVTAAAGYAMVTLVAGAAATVAGLALVGGLRRRLGPGPGAGAAA